MTHEELNTLIPLHALDALEAEETRLIEDHVAGCDRCRAELDDLRGTTAMLVPDSEAPRAVWARIVEQLEADEEAEAAPAPIRFPTERRTRTWQMVAGIAAVLAIFFAGLAVTQRGIEDLTGSQVIVAAAQRALDEPGTYSEDFLVEGTPVARLVLTEDGRGFFLPNDDLPALSADRAYQLWVINAAGDVISAGVFGHEPSPATFTWTGPVSGYALTREVAGGVVSSAGDVVSVITDT